MKKTMILCSFEFPPLTTGGIGKVASQKYRMFQETGYEVHLIAPACTTKKNRRCYRLPVRHNLLKTGMALFYGLVILIRFRPGFLYCLSGTYIGIVARILNLLTGIPYVVMAHGHEFMRFPADSLFSRVLKTIYNNACLVAAVSNFTRNELLTRGVKADKVFTVFNGVSTDDFRRADQALIELEKKRLGISPETFVLLTISRLDKRKGHAGVLAALNTLFTDIPAARRKLVYLIGGSGPEEHTIRGLIKRYDLGLNTVLLGRVREEQLSLLYSLADLFIMPNIVTANRSDAEGFGLVFLEAAACGTPSVGGKHGGSADAILDGKTGYLVDGNSTEEIKEKILMFYKDPDLGGRLGSAAGKVCRTIFSPHKLFAQEHKKIVSCLNILNR